MSDVIKTDVCIVGSGPAGAATSLMLSKLKIPHCIIDKATFPRDKTCGDGLILYAYKSLKSLGLLDEFLSDARFLHSKKINLHVKDNLRVQFKETETRDMVISYAKRMDFDHFLVSHLDDEYAHQEFGNGVKSLQEQSDGVLVKLKDGKQILANIVVGADGAQSIVSRKLAENKIDRSLMSTFVSAYFEGVSNMPVGNDAEVRIVYNKMPLFFYIFPLADGQVNVSLGGRADYIQQHNLNLIDEIESIISNHPKVQYKFTQAKKVSSWRGWTIPFHFGNHKLSGNRFLLVGDAAGLANAFYKEGVGTGMMSGIIAAKNIEQCLKAQNFSEAAFKSYESDLEKEFGKLLKFSHRALRIARFKGLFSSIVSLTKWRVEKKAPKMIQKRSY
jgi:geranylgeranyl reductase family protein